MRGLEKGVSRRDLLRGRGLRQAPEDVGPSGPVLPWASSTSVLSHCTQCGRCETACGETIIRKDADGFPTVDFTIGPCVFCGACRDACPEPVFDTAESEDQRPWALTAQIGEDCLPFRGVQCQTCQDHCDPRAIRFRYTIGSFPRPEIVTEDCTGCGACIAVCPVRCISMTDGRVSVTSESGGPG
ncbi:ferredoxin-type protein NapF [Sneathiella chinensis]|uniref:ferredoxin-type protein NapF n=1 Tax=Sneathiella chinensis TaxID=349750 RepID=UPI00146DBE7A|nr:ferredoxin-type protein NapF [Sneathiella chinensis]